MMKDVEKWVIVRRSCNGRHCNIDVPERGIAMKDIAEWDIAEGGDVTMEDVAKWDDIEGGCCNRWSHNVRCYGGCCNGRFVEGGFDRRHHIIRCNGRRHQETSWGEMLWSKTARHCRRWQHHGCWERILGGGFGAIGRSKRCGGHTILLTYLFCVISLQEHIATIKNVVGFLWWNPQNSIS